MDSTAALSIVVFIISISVIFLRRFYLSPPTTTTTNHRPFTHPVIGNLIAFLQNHHRFLDWATDLLTSSPTGTIQVDGPALLPRGVCTTDPRCVDHLLRSNFPNYPKGPRSRSVLSDLLGGGIFNSDANQWLLQRKIASGEFTTRSLRSFAAETVASEIRSRLVPLLSSAAEEGKVVDLQDVLRRFAFDNICALAFGADPACLDPRHPQEPFVAAFDEAVAICSARLFSPFPWTWRLKRLLNVGSERRLRAAIRLIDDYAMGIIASREREGPNSSRQDLLSRFAGCLEEDKDESFAQREERRRFLRDIIISFVLAGKDSTSAALTWFFWLLTQNPRCEQRIVDDIRGFQGLSDYDELKGLHYLHAAITEALRLYPPVPINSRVAEADDVLPDGTRVEAGWFADYSAYAMGRSERVWGESCREFRPERWLDGKGQFVAAEASRFPVFHAGPRVCLGRELAYVQMKAVAAAVMREFVVETVGGAAAPGVEMALTLRMKGGFPVRIRSRC